MTEPSITSGYLSDYFLDVGYKRISEVEINPSASNQHEFNGVNIFKRIFGVEREELQGVFIYLSDNEDDIVIEGGKLTWYDSRKNDPKRAAEYRLYYSSNDAISKTSPGDLMIIGKRPNGIICIFFLPKDSTVENQLLFLFNINKDSLSSNCEYKNIPEKERLNYISKIILENIGIEIKESNDTILEGLLRKFPQELPKTSEFSAFARDTSGVEDPLSDVDNTIMVWMEMEETLFKTYEGYMVEQKLSSGFESVDDFISYSLSVHNRRKSRAGLALENHLAYIFILYDISFSRNKITELSKRPDFIFPGIEQYHNPDFNQLYLAMLGVKTCCKDRWRQVLSEADKIPEKHLFTLEPGISTNQTDEMKAESLQLVLPKGLFQTYTNTQQAWLKNLNDFIDIVLERAASR